MTAAACCLWSTLAVVSGAAQPDEPVAAGRQALDRWLWPYPWYDSETDGIRAVRVSEPWYVRWEGLLERLRAFWDWLGDLFTFGGGRPWSMTWPQWLAWVGIGVLLTVLAYLLVRVWRRREQARSTAEAKAGPSDAADERRRVEALPSTAGRPPDDLLAAARECYQQGNYSEAIVYLFSHQLVHLDKRHLIRLAKGKTNRQYLRELGRRLAIRRVLEQTMVAFEDVFFGNYVIDPQRFESLWSRLDEFETLVAQSAT